MFQLKNHQKNINIKNNPKISVLMSVYNEEKYLKLAIDSILNQTFRDFEFIIIDDGSTDNSRNIIKSYTDPRIRLIVNPQNINRANSSNIGLKLATGEYIARMDGDDISLLDRFEKQVKFMDKNTDIVLSSGAIKIISNGQIWRCTLTPDECSFSLIFYNPIANGASIMRRKFLLDNNLSYNSKFIRCQDYELWSRISRIGKIAVIADVLLVYRTNLNILKKKSDEDQEFQISIRKKLLETLGVIFSNEEYILHQKISLKNNLSIKELLLAKKWFKKIKEANKKSAVYPINFNNFLNKKYKEILLQYFIFPLVKKILCLFPDNIIIEKLKKIKKILRIKFY
ncbi:MAG: glycosyltransferase family 2 protein [Candidatus Paceibacterota bacterium]|jgi:glycosyltransferase involved in cell wall biosynthesis